MDYKKFFLNDNKSGWKTKPSYLRSSEPEIYEALLAFVNQYEPLKLLPFKQQVWHFMNNDPCIPTCLNCGNQVSIKKTLDKGYSDFCSLKCANSSNIIQERASAVLKAKYGVSAFSKHESFTSKVKQTKLNKYGDENYNNFQKGIKTRKIKYGSSNNKNKSNVTLRENFIKRINRESNDKVLKYDTNDTNIILECSICNKEYKIYHNLLNYRLKNGINPCTKCNPIGSCDSFHEKDVIQFIKELLPEEEVVEGNRNIISPYELDILLPSKNIAIEFNGIYWHSDLFVEDDYHLIKTKMCREVGIELIHIFEDEWINKKDIVKSILMSKIGKNTNRVVARKTEIKEVSNSDAKDFLNTNHIQGNVYARVSIGLFYENKLVSLMTFGGLRKNLGAKSKNGAYELLRFCNKLNTTVVGAFSRLIKHFIKTYHPESLLTYSDNRYFNGDVYKNTGFSLISESHPNYFYILNHKRENRFKYRKDILVKNGFDKNKSERQIMKEREIPRIYDCGCKKWLLTI